MLTVQKKRVQKTETESFIHQESLLRLSSFVKERTGLYFPFEQWDDLERGLRLAAPELGWESPEECIEWLLSEPANRRNIDILTSYLTVGDTYFFRGKPGLDSLKAKILPDIIHERRTTSRRLKIWSAGCATGEEPYSIAILLNSVLPDVKEWDIHIAGTDINKRFLEKAAKGEYTKWSFRDTPKLVKQNYFTMNKRGNYQLKPSIMEMVKFQYLNLVKDAYPAFMNNIFGMDIILCRNVLMYFTADQARRALNGFYRTLADGGWLVLGPGDLLHVNKSDLTALNPTTPIVYRKGPAGFLSPSRREQDIPINQGSIMKDKKPQACRIFPSGLSPYEEALKTYHAGRYEAATKVLTVGLTSRKRMNESEIPLNWMLFFVRTQANQGNLSEARMWCERAISLDPAHHVPYYLKACILRGEGRIKEAIRAARQVLFLAPDFVVAHYIMGILNRLNNNNGAAEEHFANALTILNRYSKDSVLDESEGVTASQLTTAIHSLTQGN